MTTGEEETVLRRAEFDADGIIKYHWMGLIMISLLIVTIPITLIVALGYKIVLSRVIASWDCVLMTRSLNVKKGVFNKIEKTVPLEKITDLQMAQGPIMRLFDLHRISVETAGQSGPGSLISLIGIRATEDFRNTVINAIEDLVNSIRFSKVELQVEGDEWGFVTHIFTDREAQLAWTI